MVLEKLKEEKGLRLSEFADGVYSRTTYLKVAAVGMALNLLSWALALITPDPIAEWFGFVTNISDKVRVWMLAVPFWSTFLAAYALLRLPRYTNQTNAIENDDIMASFRDSERGNYVRNRILLALAIASINTIGLGLFVVGS